MDASLTVSFVTTTRRARKARHDDEKENIDPLTGERCATSSSSRSKTKTKKTTKKSTKAKENANVVAKSAVCLLENSTNASLFDYTPPSYTFNYPSTYDTYPYDDAAQAIIDSKCYELTVSPLADVSEAYGVPPGLEFSLSGADEGDEKLLLDDEDLFLCNEPMPLCLPPLSESESSDSDTDSSSSLSTSPITPTFSVTACSWANPAFVFPHTTPTTPSSIFKDTIITSPVSKSTSTCMSLTKTVPAVKAKAKALKKRL
ncbi:hypothetical protein D9758_013822 [Tetrapyrgos nigripes]|uniref:Uncharacterized protein n=1 Tax=Tetrapyrgos nigripes TaxID=182062 RepID=A0A8H5CTQ6_9AGAR|nr:hypothetical protein D9758_013822 [Tetrapyrgos nigripes]